MTLLAAALSASPAIAQPLPDALRSAGVTVEAWREVQAEVRQSAAARGASERALAAVAVRISASLVVDGRVDLDQVIQTLDARAQQVAELQSRLAILDQGGDQSVTSLLAQARAAIEAGDLNLGDQMLARAVDAGLASMAQEEARQLQRRALVASTLGERARLAFIGNDYLPAARLYGQAADTAPATDTQARWRFVMAQAGALRQRGLDFVEVAPLVEAVQVYRERALPLAPRNQRPMDWASTQHELGRALAIVGGRGDAQSLRDSLAAFSAALEVRTHDAAPRDWAETQLYLGEAYAANGDFVRAITAYHAALTVLTREATPELWSEAQNTLGIAYMNQGNEAGVRAALEAYRQALLVRTPEETPLDWVGTQINLSVAHRWLAGMGYVDEIYPALEAVRAALQVATRERSPARWATLQNGLGVTLLELARLGAGVEAARQGAEAFRSAMEVNRRDVVPSLWAGSSYNLALAYQALGQNDDARIAAQGALEAFEQLGNARMAENSRGLIEELR